MEIRNPNIEALNKFKTCPRAGGDTNFQMFKTVLRI
jgi:hypothetical protein